MSSHDENTPACPAADVVPAPEDTGTASDADKELLARRQSLKNIGRFAAYTAPAMMVLLRAPDAEAQGRGRGRGGRPGRGGGNGGGNGNGPNCDNPGLHLGFGNNHHSPC